MNTIEKVSDITYEDVAEYIRLSEVTASDQSLLNALIDVSKTYIADYTGLDIESLDDHQDFVIVVLVLCQDMYDNRTMYVDKAEPNRVVDTILGMHCVNLLPREDESDG